MSMVRLFASLLFAAASVLAIEAASAARPSAAGDTVPATFGYQGHLTDGTGQPLNGSHDLRFQLWNDGGAGNQIGSDIDLPGIAVSEGVFSVTLPVDPAHIDGRALWLRIAVDGQWLSPRQPIVATPYALSVRPGALVAGNLEGATLSLANTHLAGRAFDAHGSLIGVSAGGQTAVVATGRTIGVEAKGMTAVSAEGDVGVDARGLIGVRASSELGRAVEATSEGAVGVYGQSTGAYGVQGQSQLEAGVFGQTSGGFSAGVEGRGPTGVSGLGAVVGVSGYTEVDDMTGVVGTATGNNAKGVAGVANGYGSIGVSALAQFGTGLEASGEIGVKGTGTVNAGVIGEGVVGVSGSGKVGVAGNGTDAGVDGEGLVGVSGSGKVGVSGSGTDAGVVGDSSDGNGVRATGSGRWATSAALRADNTNTVDGLAAYFTNQSAFVNTHLRNSGSGEVLILQSTGGRFMSAMDNSWDTKFRMEYNGNAYADGSWNAGGADFAEMLPAADGLVPGDVLVIGPDGKLQRSAAAFATGVAGVYSAEPGFVGGQPADGIAAGTVPLAVVGVVPVKASAENGPIVPGDLLVTARAAGHAMRSGANPPQGSVVGKALGRLDAGTGIIRMLVSLQ